MSSGRRRRKRETEVAEGREWKQKRRRKGREVEEEKSMRRAMLLSLPHAYVIIAFSYSRDAVYTFDSKCALRHPVSSAGHPSIVHDEKFGDVCTAYIQKYSGSRNVRTFLKEVAFYGDDEYVCTGSDDGMIYMWHKLSGKLVQVTNKNRSKYFSSSVY